MVDHEHWTTLSLRTPATKTSILIVSAEPSRNLLKTYGLAGIKGIASASAHEVQVLFLQKYKIRS